MVDPGGAGIEADHMVGAGEHDPPHALAPGCLEQVVAAGDVGLEHRLPVGLDRLPAQVDDAVDARADDLAGSEVAQIGDDHLLARPCRRRRHAVRQSQERIDASQIGAQALPDAARRTGN